MCTRRYLQGADRVTDQRCNACQMNPADGCRHPLGPDYCPHLTRDPKIDIVLGGADMAALALALDDNQELLLRQWWGEPSEGVCAHFEEGMSGRCVYCDHALACHPTPPPELDAIARKVLAYKPQPKSKAAKVRKRRAAVARRDAAK